MPRVRQRTPLELGLQLNINRLISDGLVAPYRTTLLPDEWRWRLRASRPGALPR
jgi:hypothetical protein